MGLKPKKDMRDVSIEKIYQKLEKSVSLHFQALREFVTPFSVFGKVMKQYQSWCFLKNLAYFLSSWFNF